MLYLQTAFTQIKPDIAYAGATLDTQFVQIILGPCNEMFDWLILFLWFHWFNLLLLWLTGLVCVHLFYRLILPFLCLLPLVWLVHFTLFYLVWLVDFSFFCLTGSLYFILLDLLIYFLLFERFILLSLAWQAYFTSRLTGLFYVYFVWLADSIFSRLPGLFTFTLFEWLIFLPLVWQVHFTLFDWMVFLSVC